MIVLLYHCYDYFYSGLNETNFYSFLLYSLFTISLFNSSASGIIFVITAHELFLTTKSHFLSIIHFKPLYFHILFIIYTLS